MRQTYIHTYVVNDASFQKVVSILINFINRAAVDHAWQSPKPYVPPVGHGKPAPGLSQPPVPTQINFPTCST